MSSGNSPSFAPADASGSGTDTSSSEAEQAVAKQRTIEELESLSRECIVAFNDHDFEYQGNDLRKEFATRISPKFQARIETYPENALSFPELIELWRGFAAAEPNCRFHVINVSTDLHANGTAVLYLEIDVTGVQEGMVHFMRLMQMKWRIIHGKWTYYSCVTMGSTVGNNGLMS